MKAQINRNLEYLSTLTKEEADFIEHIINWEDSQKIAFKFAKKIFEDEIGADESQTK